MRLGRVVAGVSLSATLGVSAMLAPAMFYGHFPEEDDAFLPLVSRAIEGLKPSLVLPLLVGAGLLSVLLTRQRSIWAVIVMGFATTAWLPVWSILDIRLGNPMTERHNLLPFEWMIYLGLGAFGVVGAIAAWIVIRRETEPIK